MFQVYFNCFSTSLRVYHRRHVGNQAPAEIHRLAPCSFSNRINSFNTCKLLMSRNLVLLGVLSSSKALRKKPNRADRPHWDAFFWPDVLKAQGRI